MSVAEILSRAPVASIDDAIVIMRALDESLPDSDGVKWFNRLYLRVTLSVGAAVGDATFTDPLFLAKLDVVFANLYFAALAAASTNVADAPPAWRPLFECRHRPGIARVQFAFAGMNAHINRDLPDGIVRSFRALGGNPVTGDIRERDFDTVNDILERVEEEVKTEFSVGVIGKIDQLGGDVDDAVAMWKVRAARTTAWTNAQVLWELRDVPRVRDRFFARLDRLVGLAGRGLLVARPLPPG